MPDTDPAAEAAKAEQEAAAKKAADEKKAAEQAEKDKLGEAGHRALEAERAARKEADTARKTAEKAARDAQAKLDKLEEDKLSETEKLKKQAEDGQALAAKATEKLRRAHLLMALAEEGLTGGKAKAAARLLDSVEYDDADEPQNLKDAITAATAEYGEDLFKGATPTTDTHTVDQHQGARQEAAQPADEAAAFAAIFPQLRSRDELQT
jgi:colicin import membrane protein